MHTTTTTIRRTPFGKRTRLTGTLTCSCGWTHTAHGGTRANLADRLDMISRNHKWAASNPADLIDTRAPASVMKHLDFLR